LQREERIATCARLAETSTLFLHIVLGKFLNYQEFGGTAFCHSAFSLRKKKGGILPRFWDKLEKGWRSKRIAAPARLAKTSQ
jgi:hypothetical protein